MRGEPSIKRQSETDWERHRTAGRDRDKKTIGQILPFILIAIFAIGIIVTGIHLAKIVSGYQADRSMYAHLAEGALKYTAEEDEVDKVVTDDEGNIVLRSEVPITVDWEYLKEVNPDIVGWLYCEGTIINYPVVQATDNYFYLNHGADRVYNGAGALFVDHDSVLNVANSNFIVYGHNMKDGSMFHSLINYMDSDYANEHPYMYFLTPDQNYKVLIYASNIVEATSPSFTTFFRNDEIKHQYIDNIRTHAFWAIPGNMEDESYQHLVFSTCTYGTSLANPRMLVYALLQPVF